MVGGFGAALLIVIPLTAGLLLCGWVVWRLIGMWVLREISGLELLIFVGVFLGLALSAIAGSGGSGPGAFVLLALLWAGGMMYPALLALADRRKGRQLVRDDIAGYLAALEKQPDVPYPHRKLGDMYRDRGDWDSAIEHYQSYLEVHEGNPQVRFRLEKALTARRREAMGLRICPTCGTENLGDAVRCERCGFYLKGPQEIVDVLTTPEMMRIWRWLIVGSILPGVAFSILEALSAPVGISLLFLAVCLTGLYLYGKLTRREEEPA